MLDSIVAGLIGVALTAGTTLVAEPSFSWTTRRENPWPWLGIFVSAGGIVAVSVVGEKLAMPIVIGGGGAAFMTLFVYLGRLLHDRRVRGFTYPLYLGWVNQGNTVDEKKKRLSDLYNSGAIDKATFDGWWRLLFYD